MSSAPEETAPAGLFPVYRESPVSWLLIGFIGLSLLAHGLAFLIFQVVYPQRVTIPPPRMQVALLTPSSPENQAILRWIAAEDPALADAGSVATPPSLYEIPFKPSYAALRTPPRTMPVTAEKPEPAPSPITLPIVPPARSGADPASAPASPAPATSAAFSGGLAGRAFTPTAPVKAQAVEPLEPAIFLLGVNEAGDIREVFRERTSGDETADAAAAEYLSSGHFAARPGEAIAWGRATITWGREIYPGAGAPTSEPKDRQP